MIKVRLLNDYGERGDFLMGNIFEWFSGRPSFTRILWENVIPRTKFVTIDLFEKILIFEKKN